MRQAVEHPSIVPVHDMGLDEENRPYYIMKFVQGREFQEVIEDYHRGEGASASEREVQRRRLLDVFVQVCRAVGYAHHRGVIHRDLKPNNVMLGSFGQTIVLDWGLAKVLDQPEGVDDPLYGPLSGLRNSSETEAGAVIGTASYMSPEAAAGRSHELNATADVFMLGATLFHILTGESPRQGTSKEEVLEMARTTPVVSPRKVHPQTPKPLAAICLKAVARRPKDRYQSVEALAEDVERYLAGEPVSVYREGPMQRLWRWSRRNRRKLGWAASITLMVLLAAFALAALHEVRQLRLREEAQEDTTEIQRLAEDARFYAVGRDAPGESALYYDLALGKAKADGALQVMSRWGADLSQLPLPEKRGEIRQEMYELQILMVQSQLDSGIGPERSAELLEQLTRAAQLHEPTRRYYELRAVLLEQLGESDRRQEALEKAEDQQTPVTALDHFLLAEEYRKQSMGVVIANTDELGAFGSAPDNTGNREALLQKALAAYHAALRLDPEHVWSHLQIGRCLIALGDRAEAVQSFGACIALRRDSPWPYTVRGLALTLSKRFPEAMADLDYAVQMAEKNGLEFRPALFHRGVAHQLAGNQQKALADFNAALQPPVEKQLIAAAFNRAQLFRAQKPKPNIQKALDDLNLVLTERPGHRQARRLRAKINLRLRKNQQAIDDLTAYLGEDPQTVEAQSPAVCLAQARVLRSFTENAPLHRAALQLARQQLEQARDSGGDTAELFAELGSVYNELAFRLRNAALINQAEEAYGEALKRAIPDQPNLAAQVFELRGTIYANRNEFSKAVEDLSQGLRLATRPASKVPWRVSANLRNLLGYVHASQGKSADARLEAQQVVSLLHLNKADHPTVRHNLACIYAVLSKTANETENQDLAIAHLQRAVSLGGQKEVNFIRQEASFPPSLKARKDFQLLLRPPIQSPEA